VSKRYFLRLAYRGTRYHGWQRQPHSPSVQQTIEETMALIMREAVDLVGCGRTDTGVHAADYAAHFDTSSDLPAHFLNRLNRMLPADIVIKSCICVGDSPPPEQHGLHARFSATHRAYRYDLISRKDPFRENTAWHYPHFERLDVSIMNEAASLLMNYDSFAPFCKSNSDAHTMRCDLRESRWVLAKAGNEMHYHIAADRFLRGMVRLIVGACLRVGLGDLRLEDLRQCMDSQTRLPQPLSAAAHGLFLTEVIYPDTVI
jgi:tRNA pseudouridine38-40 synthase